MNENEISKITPPRTVNTRITSRTVKEGELCSVYVEAAGRSLSFSRVNNRERPMIVRTSTHAFKSVRGIEREWAAACTSSGKHTYKNSRS